MGIKILNTLTGKKEEFRPIKGGGVGMYVCGPTVYDDPHIGHARSAYVFDVIRRYFEYRNYRVTFVRNVTDVDDKIIDKAKNEFNGEDINAAVKKVSDKYLKNYHIYMDELGIRQPDVEPKATEYIDKMKDFISILIENGSAYESGGDVYFDVRKSNKYGKLSNQSLEALEVGARVLPGENKKDPLDFALWKRAKEDEVSWPSPWGPGRPGWHIECSVMSSDVLGDEFDIHGGGIDLVFPHHENEIAQSEGAGKKFAHYWIHNGLLTINKEKMAKSLGNFVTIEEILSKYPPGILKILFLQAHYSHPVDFSWEKMEEAKKAYERIDILMGKLKDVKSSRNTEEIYRFKQEFETAMDDDFNTPKGLAVLFDVVNKCNKILEHNEEYRNSKLKYILHIIKDITGVFGLTFSDRPYRQGNLSDGEIEEKIRIRLEHRKNKNYKESDRIRKELEEKGVILEDTKGATTWRRKL